MKLIFTRTLGPLSFLIRLVESFRDQWRDGFSPYSHVGIVTADDRHIIDSMFQRGGVTAPRTIESFVSGARGLIEVEIYAPDEAAAQAFLLAQVGKPYDFTDIWGFLSGRNAEDPKAWTCFELAAAVMRAGGCAMPPTMARVTCNDLIDLIRGYVVV